MLNVVLHRLHLSFRCSQLRSRPSCCDYFSALSNLLTNSSNVIPIA
jgi:hypothetical protein